MEYIVASVVFIGMIVGLAWHAVKTGAGLSDNYDYKVNPKDFE